MGERAGGFGAPEGSGEREHAEGKQECGEEEQDRNGMKHIAQADGAEEGSAHGFEGVRDGIEASEKLEPVRKDGNGKQHAAGDAGDSEEKPFGGIAALEEK